MAFGPMVKYYGTKNKCLSITRTIKVISLVTVFANRSCSQENTVEGDITVTAPLLSIKLM